MKALIASFTLFAVAPMAYAQVPRITVRVEKQADAQKQLLYARKLIADASATAGKSPAEGHAAVAVAAANLEAVGRGWPNERSAIADANALLVELYVRSGMSQNAVDAAKHALDIEPDDYRVWASLAIAQQRLGNAAAAADAFRQSEQKFNGRRGDYRENVAVLNALRFDAEKQGQFARAASLQRVMATLHGASSLDKLLYLQGALENTLKTNDRLLARKDLAALRDAYADALRESHNPMEQAAINQAADAMQRFEAMLR